MTMITISTRKQHLSKPRSEDMNAKAKQRRSDETFTVWETIHGGSQENKLPTVKGMLNILTRKTKSINLAREIIRSKKSVKTALSETLVREHYHSYYSSKENKLRSLNVYYSQSVLRKKKYIAMRTANKNENVANFVSYKTLSETVQQIAIGELYDINPKFTTHIQEKHQGDGCYRNLIQYATRLASMYIFLNQQRHDKLKTFSRFPHKNPGSTLFSMAIGDDEAPVSDTTVLLSFLNVGKRIASSKENFLTFAGNVKENGIIRRRYVFNVGGKAARKGSFSDLSSD